jgi:hypothetical protein
MVGSRYGIKHPGSATLVYIQKGELHLASPCVSHSIVDPKLFVMDPDPALDTTLNTYA